MSTKTVCDGCGLDLDEESRAHAITGERADGWSGMELPNPGKRFDWCYKCARIAFEAVTKASINRAYKNGGEV